VAEETVPEQVRVRLEKRSRMLASGIDPYPVGYPRTTTIGEVRARHESLAADTATGEIVGIAGRVILSRIGGKLCFATLRDGTGDIQVMISLARVGEEALTAWKRDVDLGDHVGVTGEVITSRSGELSVLADSFAITAKSLRPLPEKHAGLTDPETRVRQRYVDLIVNPQARRLAEMRSAVVQSVRSTLIARGFLEVETPVLTGLHGGANARPFITHGNAYDSRLYLRIALELYLKRLVVGGIESVFEIGRIFRNEGVDTTHNPEFTMLEAYQTYSDYTGIGELTKELVQNAAVAAFGSTVIRRADGSEWDIGGEWRSLGVHEAISLAAGEEITPDTELPALLRLCEQLDVPLQPSWNRGQVILEMYERLVEKQTVEPTFYRDFPVEVSPLTRQHRSDPRLAERWDLVTFGTELGTGYSELVDPVVQRERLTAQSLLAAGGDPEAMELDEDFLLALEYAMPPTGGMGMGLDRLMIMLTGENIRETILFPFVRQLSPGGATPPVPPDVGVRGPDRKNRDRVSPNARRLKAAENLSSDADGADVRVPEDRLHLDDLAGARRVYHQAVAEVEADVADVGEEEHQVTRLKVGPGDVHACVPLVAGVVRQGDALLEERPHDQAGAVVRIRAGRAPDVRLAALG
jgi:lysyl-tRNA synthetase class 2